MKLQLTLRIPRAKAFTQSDENRGRHQKLTPDRISYRQLNYRRGRHDIQVYIGNAGQASESLSGLPAVSARERAVGQEDSRQAMAAIRQVLEERR